jgi:hypothetical protein
MKHEEAKNFWGRHRGKSSRVVRMEASELFTWTVWAIAIDAEKREKRASPSTLNHRKWLYIFF